MTLFKQQARAEWFSLLIWSLVLGLLTFWMVVLYGSLSKSGAMADMQAMLQGAPASLQSLYQANVPLASLTGWLQAYAFGPVLLIGQVIFTGLFVTGMITREMDRHTMGFLLSLPISRWQLLLSRWMGLGAALAVLQMVHGVAVTVGVIAIGSEATFGRYLVAELNSFLMLLALGGVLLALSLFVDDYGKGIGLGVGVGLGLLFFYLETDGGPSAIQVVRNVLPPAFYSPGPILSDGVLPVGDMAVLAAGALGALGVAAYLFHRKPIAV